MVCQTAVPQRARTRSTLSRVDYADAFTVEIAGAPDRTAAQWARALLEGPPGIERRALRVLLSGVIGLRLGPTGSTRFVEGWAIEQSEPDAALLAASSPRGLSAELLFARERRTLLFATFVKLDTPLARAIWTALAPVHRRVARQLMGRAT